MKEIVITSRNVTKDYGQNRGNFDINLKVYKGETLGIMGENGAGKTTFLRELMGFISLDKGNISIYSKDAYKDSALLKNYISYIPGEINFPDLKTGDEFLKNYAKESSLDNEYTLRASEIIKRMQLDITAYPRRMSKGMKQKTSIVAALMKDYPLIIMDEPTTGLDPLMRDEFLNLILEEKKKNKTIIMTSNTIEELEKVCDRVAFMNKGRISAIIDINDIKNRTLRDYKIEFNNVNDYLKIKDLYKDYIFKDQIQYNQLTLRIDKDKISNLIHDLNLMDLKFISYKPYTLQTYFNENISKGVNKNGK